MQKPTDGQLQLGELAVNFYDGKIFLKQDTGGVGVSTRIVEVGAGTTTFAGKTFLLLKMVTMIILDWMRPMQKQRLNLLLHIITW